MSLFDAPPVYGPETMNCLLYGSPGAGKTTGAATAPGPIVWVNLDGSNALVSLGRLRRSEEPNSLRFR